MSESILQAEGIKRVVVRGANWVGDAVMTVPALRELRRLLPEAHITLATRAWAEGIFAGADFIDELLLLDWQLGGLPAYLQQWRAWRQGSYDLALLFPNAFEPALMAAAARVPLRIGYATDARRTLLTHPLAVPAWRRERHEVFYYLNLVSELERLLSAAPHAAHTEPRLDLYVSDERQAQAREILRQHGITLDGHESHHRQESLETTTRARPLVALCPGSTNSRAKRWPTASYAALADQLIEEAGADCLVVGAPDELDVTAEVVGQMRRRPFVLTGQTSLAELVAVLSLVDLLITNDTGPAHIAAALNRPALVIFGPTDPNTTRPFSALAEVVREPPDCAPCMLRDCPIDHRCMTAITPAQIFARALRILAPHDETDAARTHVHKERTRVHEERIDVHELRTHVHELRADVQNERTDVHEERTHVQDERTDAYKERTRALGERIDAGNEASDEENGQIGGENEHHGALFEHTGAGGER